MEMIFASGYGISHDDLVPYLKEEYQEVDVVELSDKMNKKILTFAFFASCENSYVYVPNISPYEKSCFKDREDLDNYFYKELFPYLKEGVSKNKIMSMLDDIFDYDFC